MILTMLLALAGEAATLRQRLDTMPRPVVKLSLIHI